MIQTGDELVLSTRPTGIKLAAFMSIIRDPDICEQFYKVILVHGVREVSELAYQNEIECDLANNPYLGDLVKQKLLYYPTDTREKYQYNS